MLSSRLGSLVADGAEALTAGIYGGHAGAELPPGMAVTWLGATVTLPLQGQKQRDHTIERTRSLLLFRQRPKIAAETAPSTERMTPTTPSPAASKQASTPLHLPRPEACTQCTKPAHVPYKERRIYMYMWPPLCGPRSLGHSVRLSETGKQRRNAATLTAINGRVIWFTVGRSRALALIIRKRARKCSVSSFSPIPPLTES